MNILITEREEITVSPQFEKIVSVSYRPGIEYFYDYWGLEKYEELYYGIDKALDEFISESRKEELCFYRDVSLLQCFRLTLFLYFLNAEILRRTFNRLANRYPEARFSVENNDFNSEVPYLSHILPETSRVTILEKRLTPTQNKLSVKNLFKKLAWPLRIETNLAKDPKVLIYADYYRASSVMKRLGSSIYYTSFPEPKIFFESIKNRFSYVQKVYSKGDPVTFTPSTVGLEPIIERSFNNFPELRGVLRKILGHLFQNELSPVLFQIDRAHELFQKHNSLQSVLLDEDLSASKNAFCQVAQKFGKKCFVEAHGALGDKYGYLPLTADFMFVWGSPQKEKLIDWGCAADRLIISGCSKYEAYKNKNEIQIRSEVSKNLGLNPQEKIVSLFPFPNINKCYPYNKILQTQVESILNALKLENIQLVIKLHPGENNKSFYHSWAEKNNAKCKITVIQRTDSLLLVKASDVLIVHDSTMAMDGFAMEKPVIFFPLFPENAYSNDSVSELKKYGVFKRPKDMNEFSIIFKKSISNPKANENCEARKEYLNEGSELPEVIISSHLIGNKIEAEYVKNA